MALGGIIQVLTRTPSSSGASPACPDPQAWLCMGLGERGKSYTCGHEPNGVGVSE